MCLLLVQSVLRTDFKKLYVAPFMTLPFQINDYPPITIYSPLQDGKSFSVVNQDAFQTSVLRDFFNGSKFSSFVRQLNVYGFRKTSHGKPWEFSNELFLRGRPDLLPSLKRRKPRPSRTDDAAGAVLQNALAEAAAAIQSAALSMLFKSNSGGGAGGDGPSNETTQNALAALNALHTANRMIQKRESGSLEAGGVRSESGGQGAGAGPFAGLGVGGGEQLLAMLAQQQQQQMSQQVQLQKRIKRVRAASFLVPRACIGLPIALRRCSPHLLPFLSPTFQGMKCVIRCHAP